MNASVVAHLLTLASFRKLELAQSIRLARMQLPEGSPAIAALVIERDVNDAAIKDLQAMHRMAA